MAFTKKTYTEGQTVITAQNLNDINNFLGGGTGNLADYVVEQGTSGSWTYRKWASGVAECWLESELTLTGSTPVANMNGSAYLSYVDVDLPFTFKTQPRGMANGVLGTGTGFVNVWCRNGYNEITVYVTGNQNSAAITIRLMIVTGRWKQP